MFALRLIVYNETFAVVMPEKKEMKAARRQLQRSDGACIVWHSEADAGRSAEEVAAAFYLFLDTICRNRRVVTIWADNCAGQNKNWALISVMLQVVNSPLNGIQTLTFKFFEPGHTAMVADAVHQSISKNIRATERLEDFSDYVAAVEATGMKCIKMSPGNNMHKMEDGISKAKLKRLSADDERPYLARLKVISVRRGSELVFTKTSIGDNSYKAYDLTMTTFDPTEQPELLPASKKPGAPGKATDVLRSIAPHMRSHKRVFWEELVEQSTRNPKGDKRMPPGRSPLGRKKRKAS